MDNQIANIDLQPMKDSASHLWIRVEEASYEEIKQIEDAKRKLRPKKPEHAEPSKEERPREEKEQPN
jgi:hypothetical protein